MKILYDYQIFSSQQYGGISRYFFEIANRIAASCEHEVAVLAPFFVNRYLRNRDGVRLHGMRMPYFPYCGIVFGAANRTATRLFPRERRSADIVHETYYSPANCYPPSTKRVTTVHDMIHERFPDNFSPDGRVRQAKRHAVAQADHVICDSHNTKKDLIELAGVPDEKITVVHLGVSPASGNPVPKPVDVERPFVLYVGLRIPAYKNFERLLEVYSRSALLRENFSLVCFGGGPFNRRELDLMNTMQIPSRKVKHVAGADDVLAGLYASAAVLVYPSVYEGFGIPPLEAMSFGCPVACANGGSLPEVAGAAAEMFDPLDSEEMTAAIENVLSTPERAKDLIRRGYEHIKQFSWDRCAEETLNVYKKIA
jgi:glycosyltransferase involved in cell wall biosynthesis